MKKEFLILRHVSLMLAQRVYELTQKTPFTIDILMLIHSNSLRETGPYQHLNHLK